jgi:H+/gluconate symporter-like permease
LCWYWSAATAISAAGWQKEADGGGRGLAAMNTASEYGFGAVIAALPGFLVLSKALAAFPIRC